MIRYQAPNPYPKKSSLLSLFSSSTSSTSIGKIVLPAQWRQPITANEMSLERLASRHELIIKGGFVGTHDDALLDTIELKPTCESYQAVAEQYFIVKFNGNGGQYQDVLNDYAYDAAELRTTVIGFNYRGVGNSKKAPERFRDLVTDGIAEVQRLLDQGARPEHVTLDGLSLGASVATMVASHFHKLGQRVYLWNDRSFSTLPKAAAGMIAPEYPGLLGDTSESSLASTSWSVMKPVGWDVNVTAAYNAIDPAFKGYMVVAKKSARSDGDGVIAHFASLHVGVKAFEKRNHYSTGHKVFAHSMFGGHNLPREALVSKEDPVKSGHHIFEEFVRSHRN